MMMMMMTEADWKIEEKKGFGELIIGLCIKKKNFLTVFSYLKILVVLCYDDDAYFKQLIDR